MTFWTVLKTTFTLLPEIIDLIKNTAQLVESGYNEIRMKILLGKFNNAVEQAKTTKNTSALENMFNPK